MNSQKKKKIAFNIIDVILIIAVLASILALVFFLRERKIINPQNEQTVKLEYTISFSPLREEFRNLAQIGDTVVDASILENIGEIVNVSYLECRYEGINEQTGQKVYTPYPGMITMVITVRADAVKTASGYEINGHEIIIGNNVTVRVPFFTGTGTCTSISTVD